MREETKQKKFRAAAVCFEPTKVQSLPYQVQRSAFFLIFFPLLYLVPFTNVLYCIQSKQSYLSSTKDVKYNFEEKRLDYVNTAISSGPALDKKLADAIFLAEGGFKTAYPYGIRSVNCVARSECRQICLNTIRNNRARWKTAGKPGTYLEFLARRYAPLNSSNDPNGLNRHWLKNVSYFLTKGMVTK